MVISRAKHGRSNERGAEEKELSFSAPRTRAASFRVMFAGDFSQLPNRPFYRYGGHIELIRFKEYYRMPREREHISFVFSSPFRDVFS